MAKGPIAMNMALDKIFKVKKPVIGMVHLGKLEFPEFEAKKIANNASYDIKMLQQNGIDGLLIENWQEDSVGELASKETVANFLGVVLKLKKVIKVPFGINVLNNDHAAAFKIARKTRADFVQLDVFVDEVVSDFSYSQKAKLKPFVIKPEPKKIYQSGIPLFVFVQPKHYRLLEKDKPMEKSVRQAVRAGAAGLLVTKATGVAPTKRLIKRAKSAAGWVPVGIGSGFGPENAREYLSVADFAIVGTALKVNNVTDNPVDPRKVKKLMEIVKKLRR